MKKNSSIVKQLFFAAVIAAIAITAACNRKFDAPPNGDSSAIPTNYTISQLKALLNPAIALNTFQSVSLSGNNVIGGVVIANDSSGNLYNQIIIRDSTGAIPVLINENNLYNKYPIGRMVYVKLNGLTVGTNSGSIVLGANQGLSSSGRTVVTAIAQKLEDTFLVRGSFGNAASPIAVSFSDLQPKSLLDPLQSQLVTLSGFQFPDAALASTYADSSLVSTFATFNLVDCSGDQIELYNSSYAAFAGLRVPSGNGAITGIYTSYNGAAQLQIRDTGDVQFYGTRCGSGPSTAITVADLRVMYATTNTDRRLGAAYTVSGVVISDVTNKNIANGNYILQSGAYGIDVYQGGTVTFNVGDSVVITLQPTDSLINYRGSLELKCGSTSGAVVATGKTVTPVVTTIQALNASLAKGLGDTSNHEYTLMQIQSASVPAAPTTFSGNKTLTDATASMTLYTATAATFAGSTINSGNKNWNGYANNFNGTYEFQIRNLNDTTTASGGSTPPPPPTGSGINLGTTSPFIINFDTIGTNGLPQGVTVSTTATATALGTAGTFTQTATAWNNTGAGFKNYASASTTGFTSATAATDQSASTNRALGVRQTGTAGTGGDPGASFVFQLSNTVGKSNMTLSFELQSVDGVSAAGRTVAWTVDYATGSSPTDFTSIATSPATLTTVQGTFGVTPVTVSLPAALNNQSSEVWIRVSALTVSSGSGSRPATAIDNFQISW